MPRIKPACVRRVSIGDSSGSCSDDDVNTTLSEDPRHRVEEHMCPRCQEQFENIHEFIHHKQLCDAKALQMGEERMHSDPEEMVVSGDEEMDEPHKRLEQVRRHRQDAANNNSLDDNEAEVPEPDVPPIGIQFPVASHVTLEALQNTKVAVAQFAATAMANNADNEAALHELAVLQSTLFTLQHQQVFQLQLIRQLQNQLSLKRRKDSNESPPPTETENNEHTPQERSPSPQLPPREPTPSVPTPPTSQILPSNHGHHTPKSEPISVPKHPTTSPPMMSHPPYSSISSSLASTIITNNDPPPSLNAPNTLEMLQKRAQEVLDNASQGLLANNLADELAFRKSGKVSPYDGKSGGRNEPFFKHRCRYCGKVFGSDSALQIHIRSHTGERPFKCNVCGSRFTTKGNLKVHFQRHTSKFPHVKMNPNPVPEHLDKYHPPLLAQLSPGPIPGMHHPLQFPPGGPSPFPPGLPLYRPAHHDLLPPRPLSDKPLPPHPLFTMREEQDVPADLSKPSLSSPSRSSTDAMKSEPHDDEHLRDSSFDESDRISPKRELDDSDAIHDVEPDRYPLNSPYDDCSMDSKYSNEDQTGRESPQVKPDPDQPENLSSKNSPISGSIPLIKGLQTFPSYPMFNNSPPSSISSGSVTPFQNMNNGVIDQDISKDSWNHCFNTKLPQLGCNDNSWESLIEITKSSDMTKLQQLVDSESKVSDPNECIVCHRVLSCKSALQMHYRIHTGERPFRCKLCGRSFTTKGNLKTHMSVHRIRPTPTLHQCSICHKKFTDLILLHQHIQYHNAERDNFNTTFFLHNTQLLQNRFMEIEVNDDIQSFRPFLTPSTPGDRRTECHATDDESGRDDIEPAACREFDDENILDDRRTSPLSVSTHVSEKDIKHITTTASFKSATGSESGRSARATPPSSPALSTPPPLRNLHHSPLPSPPTPLAALGALGGSPFNPLGLAFPPAVRGNTTCNICYKTFACNSALEIHYRSHTKERPFKCTVCDRGFSTKSSGGGCRCGRRARMPHATALDMWNAFVYPGNMKQHMLTHKIRDMPPGFDKSLSSGGLTSEENTRDASPERRSPEKIDLKRSPTAHQPPPQITHAPIDMPPMPKRPNVPSIQSHPPPPPPASSKHLCGVCRKNFSSSSALQIHMRTHTGDKPFRCAVCQKAFTTKGNLKVHMGTHMWSGGASRRGRRMSLELPPRPIHEPHDLLRRPDLFYPYLPAPFLNGMQQKLNEISVIQQGQNGVAGKFPGLLGFGAFAAARPGAGSPLERPPSIEANEERQAAAMRELAERGRELAERTRHMREESDQYRSQPHGVHQPPSTQPSPPSAHLPLQHPLASLPPPARTEGLTV